MAVSGRGGSALLLCGVLVACGSSGGGGQDDFFDGDGGSDADADADADSDSETGTGALAENPLAADEVVDAPGDTGEGFGDAGNAVNGVRGGGAAAGSTDVFSLGYEQGVDNYIVLGFGQARFHDGPGSDLAVFENAFEYGGDAGNFMDHVIVEVSADGQSWVALPHDYVNEDETVYSTDPPDWPGFAGVTPVLLHEETNPVDPFDPELAGGDHFDLADLPADAPATAEVLSQGAAYVKLTTAPSTTNPDTQQPYVREEISDGADIDGVYVRYPSVR
ncbi:MAG: LIC_13355 family lipoprotein [Polyangia bacterium]